LDLDLVNEAVGVDLAEEVAQGLEAIGWSVVAVAHCV
jgi:hypothetical protein